MLNNKWIILLIVCVIVFGILIITNAHFNVGGGMGNKTIQLGVQ
jgi:hypothetical protein